MLTEEDRQLVLPRKFGDRALTFILAAVLTFSLWMMHEKLEQEAAPTPWQHGLRAVTLEALYTFGFFTALALVWALFRPRWVEHLLTTHRKKLLLTLALLFVAAGLTVVYHWQ